MEPFDREWKRQFSLSFYKNMKLKLAEMTFLKDFVTDRRGDLYPILNKSTDCLESVSGERYCVTEGTAERWIGGFFPYATYEITAELELTCALFYDVGDGFWCGDVAASVCYHREARMWYLWVCSFSHGHRLAHASFAGDPRFGINVIDVTLMEKAPDGTPPTAFLGFPGDEDPDFFYDAEKGRWLMAVCRIDPENGQQYRYYFFESSHPFESYRYLGRGKPGCETGGSFVRIGGETAFVCGNDFHAVSNYRVYTRNGMTNARFNYPDGGFRGWGTVLPIPMGSRTRCFWMTFDRHNGSDYNWSYGNLYVFEASNIYNK